MSDLNELAVDVDSVSSRPNSIAASDFNVDQEIANITKSKIIKLSLLQLTLGFVTLYYVTFISFLLVDINDLLMIHIHVILIRFCYISILLLKFPVPFKLTKSRVYCIKNYCLFNTVKSPRALFSGNVIFYVKLK